MRYIRILKAKEELSSIDTPEFKNWFGDSKVVDKSGNPFPVYHATDKVFESFDKNFIGSRGGWLGAGFYFSLQYDSTFGNISMPVYLSMQNPYYPSEDKINQDGTVTFAPSFKEDIKNKFPELRENFNSKEVQNVLKSNGYDGIIYGNVFVVFEPNQIKSVTNKGKWDNSDSNIYSSKK